MRNILAGRAFTLLLLCLVCLAGTGRGASAHVIFRFDQLGQALEASGLESDLAFSGLVVVTPEAFASGFDVTFSNSPGLRPYEESLDGLLRLDLSFRRGDEAVLDLSLDDLRHVPFPGIGFINEIRLGAAPGGRPFGSIEVNTTEVDVFVVAEEGRFAGNLGSDGLLGCFSARCGFAGEIAVAVPGPASLALFTSGLVVLAAFRRRTARRP